jgi:cell division protein FtsA
MQDLKAIFDIWNWYIKWALIGKDEDKLVVLAKEMIKTKGMRKGKILDSDDFLMSLSAVIESFHKKLGDDYLDQVFVGISHPELVVTRMHESKRIMTDKITHDDINHLSKIVSDVSGQQNYEIIKIIPVQWIIDDLRKEKDPLGLTAKKLELVADVFMVPKSFYNNLIEVFDKVNLRVVDIVPTILGTSEVVLDFDLKDLWACIIDIWANQTTMAVYEEWTALSYYVLPVGGEDVTRDISLGLQVDIKEAEEIKRRFGQAPQTDKVDVEMPIDQSFLQEVIGARYEQIFGLCEEHLESLERDARLPWGVFLVWGWAKADWVDQIAKSIFRLATFKWKDIIYNLGDLSVNQQLVSLIGIYARADKYYEGSKSRLRGISMSNFNLWGGQVRGKIRQWIKNVF